MYSEDGSTKSTSIQQYYDVVLGTFENEGISTCPGAYLKQWFQEVGFEDVHVKKYFIPMGSWPKDEKLVCILFLTICSKLTQIFTINQKKIGLWNLLQAESGFEAGAMAVLTRYAGWSKEEVTVLVAKTRSDARNPAIHALFDL